AVPLHVDGLAEAALVAVETDERGARRGVEDARERREAALVERRLDALPVERVERRPHLRPDLHAASPRADGPSIAPPRSGMIGCRLHGRPTEDTGPCRRSREARRTRI